MTPAQHEPIDDETLTAFLDGELSDEQNARIEQAINDDSELAARVERLAQVGELASQAYRHVLDEPVPQRLLDTVRQDDTKQPPAEVVNLPTPRLSTCYVPIAAAASLALVIGTLLGPQFAIDSGVVAQNPLYVALEKTPSQQRFKTGDDYVVTPMMSFRAIDGRYCREFQVNTGGKQSLGVACKQNGYWNTETLLTVGRSLPDGQVYRPASGDRHAALDTVLDDLWAGEAYGQAEEKALIQQAWR